MKGYLIELRKKSDPNFVVGSGSVTASATAERRFTMAQQLLGKSHKGDYFVVEHSVDWGDCSDPKMTEVARYDISSETQFDDTPPPTTPEPEETIID